MTAMVERALNKYSALEVETTVNSASPERLVVMLYEGALKAVFTAKRAMTHGETALKGEAISKAIAILDQGLRPALDLENGGGIAANLLALYDYVSTRLLYANLKNDASSLDEAARLLTELKGAWEALEQSTRPAAVQPLVPPSDPRAPVSFGKA
jgi:flagellar secretion chaperone FliS